MEMVCPRKLENPDNEHNGVVRFRGLGADTEHAPRASDLTQGGICFIVSSFRMSTIHVPSGALQNSVAPSLVMVWKTRCPTGNSHIEIASKIPHDCLTTFLGL